jgi:ABC-type protease/lipase transport system fused ATPase/permease subunit
VPQRVDFIKGSIEENITGLDIEPNKDRLVRAARFAQIHRRIAALPEGYATRIDPIGSIFSKSERHQIALARAFYPDPRVLVLDEPDTAFRNGLAKELKGQIERFLARGGILIVLTRLPLKNFEASKNYTLNNGILKETEIDRSEDNVVSLQNVDAR